MSNRHKVFVSYHHALDESYKKIFELRFGNTFGSHRAGLGEGRRHRPEPSDGDHPAEDPRRVPPRHIGDRRADWRVDLAAEAHRLGDRFVDPRHEGQSSLRPARHPAAATISARRPVQVQPPTRFRRGSTTTSSAGSRAIHNWSEDADHGPGLDSSGVPAKEHEAARQLSSVVRQEPHRATSGPTEHASRPTRSDFRGGRVLKTTPVFDTYWRFASERQEMFMRRVHGEHAAVDGGPDPQRASLHEHVPSVGPGEPVPDPPRDLRGLAEARGGLLPNDPVQALQQDRDVGGPAREARRA